MASIEVVLFHKSFGSVQAVRNVNLSVDAGELYGLIGPDGAGKTTLLRAICTLLLPDQGNIKVAGLDTRSHTKDIRKLLGYMPQRFSLYQDLSVEQNLRFFADLFQVPRSEQQQRMERLYAFSRLGDFKKRLAGQLSGGMKQKLALSCALVHTPEILVLDEPTFGVDPVSRKEFWEILHEIRKGGATILVSTAYMDEADQCERVGLMFGGRMITEGTPATLKRSYPFPLYRIKGRDLHRLRQFFREQSTVHTTQLFGDSLHVSFIQHPEDDTWKAWAGVMEADLSEWKPQLPSIEDIFLEHLELTHLPDTPDSGERS